MATHWKLDEQDEKLRELVARARSDGPQQIEDEGQGVAVVVSLPEFERLRRGESRREGSLVEFFRSSPLVEPTSRSAPTAPSSGRMASLSRRRSP
jgi:prevent-host-death family protein